MSRKQQNTAFVCRQCGAGVRPLTNGSYRNHCPACLYSAHLDVSPGDRRSTCRGLMAPVGLRHRPGKGLQIVHRCLRCGAVRVNRVATDTDQPDDIDALVRLPSA